MAKEETKPSITHLYGGLQSINFTESNNTASQSIAEYYYGMLLTSPMPTGFSQMNSFEIK